MLDRFEQLMKHVFGAVGQRLGQASIDHDVLVEARSIDVSIAPETLRKVTMPLHAYVSEEEGGGASARLELPATLWSIDVLFWRAKKGPKRQRRPTDFGIIGRMLGSSCVVELCRRAQDDRVTLVGMDDALDRSGERREDGLRMPPRLWLVSAERPERSEDMVGGMRWRPLEGEPGHVWVVPSFRHVNIAVVCDLPVTRECLLMRLAGVGQTRREALMELTDLPLDAWEVRMVRPLMVALGLLGGRARGPDTVEYMEELYALSIHWRREAMAAGHEKALRESLRDAYRVRFGQEPAALAGVIDTSGWDELERWLSLVVTGSSEEVAAAVQREVLERHRPDEFPW